MSARPLLPEERLSHRMYEGEHIREQTRYSPVDDVFVHHVELGFDPPNRERAPGWWFEGMRNGRIGE